MAGLAPSETRFGNASLQAHLSPESPASPNPPTPDRHDISMQALSSRRDAEDGGDEAREPPAYSPLDAYTYADGVHIDLPAEFIAAALEGSQPPASAVGQANRAADRHHGRSNRRAAR